MNHLIHYIDSPEEILSAGRRLRVSMQQKTIEPDIALDILERWGAALDVALLRDAPGLAFLRLWLRRSSLEPMLLRELGTESLTARWWESGRARLRAFPVGVVGHWPAGNVDIQPLLSMTCSLLGGNACLVRVPAGLEEVTQRIMERLEAADPSSLLAERIFIMSFDHSRNDLQKAMAQSVDGAMIWGGEEAIAEVRSLPFPHWARIAVFGPRMSVAAMDTAAWSDPAERSSWCRRIARDVWQFDQRACSSPQALFLESSADSNPGEFIEDLVRAFDEENHSHPREELDPASASAICIARASWLLEDTRHRARFSVSPDWTILVGTGTEIPKPVQRRALHVLLVENLFDVVLKFDGTVQTLGLGIKDAQKEEELAQAAGRRGIDRIVKLGSMHAFTSPWDGMDLVRPMVRLVRYVCSHD